MKTVMSINTKGGTGKTMYAINLAKVLKDMGYKVGYIDADFDSSNFAEFTKTNAELDIIPGNRIQPYIWHGIQVFSWSLFTGDRAVSMKDNRYTQMLADVLDCGEWDVDFMIVDAPAGSSDVFKGIVSIFADTLVGSVGVLHPSSHDDAIRVIKLHLYNEIPLIGVVENMAYVLCPECKHKFHVFRDPYGKELKEKYGVEVFGQIPLTHEITEGLEIGEPFLTGPPKGVITKSAKAIIAAKIQKPGFLNKIKLTVGDKLLKFVGSVMGDFINISNQAHDIESVKKSVGFVDKSIFDIVITDNNRERVLLRVHLRLDEKIHVLTSSEKEIIPKYEIVFDFPTLCRIIVGKIKLLNGTIVNYDYMDAYLNGDIEVYGEGHLPKVAKAFKVVFENELIMKPLRVKYGKLLERFI